MLFADFKFPEGNPTVLKWVSPVSLDQIQVDVEFSNAAASASGEALFEKVADHLEVDDLDQAIATWSSHVENHL